MKKPIRKRFDIMVTEAEKTVSQTFELDKNIVSVKGLLMTSNSDDLLYYRGSQRIEINKEELFPENYESKLLMSGINVAPKSRYYELEDVNIGNGLVRIEYQDRNNPTCTFSPYRVSLYLLCEMTDDK